MLRIDRKLLAVAVVLALGVPCLTARAAIIAKPKPEPVAANAVVGVVVTDTDPQSLLQARRAPGSLESGPFDGPKTLQLYIIAVYDRTKLGDIGFDQVAKFVLPDGNVYETRIDPVDPSGLRGSVLRGDLAPHPVETLPVMRARRLARALPAGMLTSRQLKNAALVSIPLPVSGTWVTSHGLYGTWQVEISAMKDGKVLSSNATSFTIEAGR